MKIHVKLKDLNNKDLAKINILIKDLITNKVSNT